MSTRIALFQEVLQGLKEVDHTCIIRVQCIFWVGLHTEEGTSICSRESVGLRSDLFVDGGVFA